MTLQGQARTHALDADTLRGWPLAPLEPGCDKELRGRVVLVAGSREIPGAALLSAQAALRAGAGKVLVATAESVAMHVAVAMPELRVVGLPETRQGGLDPAGLARLDDSLRRADVVLVGPGLQDEEAAIALAALLRKRHPDVPTLLDAAAMGAAARDPQPGAPALLTPHAGEMAHLNGQSKDSVVADAEGAAREAARWWNSIVALKGATTVIAEPQGDTWVHEGGNPGLATAGSGDVLAGLIAGFAARGATLVQATAWGVVVHARAGDRLAARVGGMGFLASELLAEVPEVVRGLAAPAGRRLSPIDRPGAAPAGPVRRTAG
ncbi:MAG TPA: NAD(P)H-hydrate dehydratase [Rhizobacter sp.]